MEVNFDSKVRAACSEAGISLNELERRCDFKKGKLFMVLTGNNPTLKTIGKVAEGLQLTVSELLK